MPAEGLAGPTEAEVAAAAYFEPRRNPLGWRWRWSFWLGVMYGPIPVGVLIALPILIAVNL